MNQKFLFLVLSNDNEMARAAHALMYANELHEAGHPIQIVFDGAGVKALAFIETNPERPVHQLYQKLKAAGTIAGVCEHCTTSFKVEETIEATGLTKLNDLNNHVSIAKYVAEGYSLVTM